jgi:hypothetical protein
MDAMSLSCRSERSLLSREEYELVRETHQPQIYDLDLEGLQSTQTRLRQMRDKERTLTRQKRREVRGKADPRGGSFPGTAERPLQRKQAFAAALKRVNKEIGRATKFQAREALIAASHRALALRRSAEAPSHPSATDTGHSGMRPITNSKRRTRVLGVKIGRVSQATKNAQAIRDARD